MYSSISSGTALRAVPTRLVVVAGLHVAAIWALMSGLHLHALAGMLPQASEATLIEQAPKPEDPVILKFPILPAQTVITDVKPVVDPIDDYSQPTRQAEEPGLTAPASGSGTILPIPTPAPVITGAAVDPRHPLTQPAYPPAAIRSNEEGALNLAVLVGVDGRVRDVKVADSSGSARLDQAAMSEARLHWRLRPATRNGVPFEQWLTLRVVFHLENR